MADFRASLTDAAPAPGLEPPLAALWWAAKGRLGPGAQDRAGRERRDAAWVHAYLHRVEGDLGNAGYWYRQAGQPVAKDSPGSRMGADRIRAAREWKSMNAHVKPGKLIKGQTGDWEVVIGMEVHAQVTSKSKLFSGASTETSAASRTAMSTLVDTAIPGLLPIINLVFFFFFFFCVIANRRQPA